MKLIALSIILLALPSFLAAQSAEEAPAPLFGQTFIPDYTFDGSLLNDWNSVGNADWQADNGDIIGTVEDGESGLLIFDRSFQDIGFRTLFTCSGECEAGVILRLEETNEGMTGIFHSLTEGDVIPYRITVSAEGDVISRDNLYRAGGLNFRMASPLDEENLPPVVTAGGGGGFGFGQQAPDDLPVRRPDTSYRSGEWNQIELFLDTNVIRSFFNDGSEIGARTDGLDNTGLKDYGPVALYVGGNGEVRYREIMIKDIGVRYTPDEEISPRFNMQTLNDMYYSWGANAADFNLDGHMDVVAGPYIYYGPDYTDRREVYPARAVGPSEEFSGTHLQDIYDFNDDGYPDIVSSAFSSSLYINPGEENRRWDQYSNLPGSRQGEITQSVDIDNDGIPEMIYSGGPAVRYAKPVSTDPEQPWQEFTISENGYGMSHGIGTGDINGDGRIDILNAVGWWEQPEMLGEDVRWEYHPVAFGRYGFRSSGIGGSIMGVYDVNGNGLNDVVTSLNVHGFGLAWYEQHRDENGEISFTRHMISDDYSADNTGGVTFSQAHGNTFGDVDNDGIMDLIVGKRYWTHLDNYLDPDPYGPPVLYAYKTVRDTDAPGGARFEPELIHNRSGAGTQVSAVDLNSDGAVEVITSTNHGTFIFWNNP